MRGKGDLASSYFLLFVAMPIFVLACVCLFTMLITYPMALIFGWL